MPSKDDKYSDVDDPSIIKESVLMPSTIENIDMAIFEHLDNNLNIYMPPRTPDDSVIKSHWPKKFIDVFKIAQNKPYPKWI